MYMYAKGDKMKLQCNCGGVNQAHNVGDHGCFRKHEPIKPRKVSCSEKWFVDGRVVTEFTLLQQRGYYQHPCGNWSKPVDGKSVNSISDAC